jgi:hypothetical protein
MKLVFSLMAAVGVAMAASADPTDAPILGGKLPGGYRDWRLISVAHEAGSLDDIRAILGNDLAVEAYRSGRLPFPDGAVVARIAWKYVPSAENDKAFGQSQSFVAGPPTNVQFMVKNSWGYASTGGWGFAQFDGGKATPVTVAACFSCHVPAAAHDFLFTRYAP